MPARHLCASLDDERRVNRQFTCTEGSPVGLGPFNPCALGERIAQCPGWPTYFVLGGIRQTLVR